MIKLKRKSTKKGSNLTSNIQPLISGHRGITLVALIITIIVMLILVGVSITIAINGRLFDTTKKVAKDTEKAKNKEQELGSGRIQIDGIWYDSLEDYAIGKASEYQPVDTEPTDLNTSNTEFIYEPAGWTSGKVKIKIEVKEKVNGMLQYSRDGISWERYVKGTEIEIENNGEAVYARVINDKDEVGTVATGNVQNIDREAPIISTELSSPNQMTSSIDLKIGVTDKLSGFSKIEWYYKRDGESGEYKSIKPEADVETNGKVSGIKTEVIKETRITGLQAGTYNIYAEVYDVAGNKTRHPETGIVNIATGEMPEGNGNIGFNYSKNWTNGEVEVTIENKTGISEYKIKYSKDGSNWEDYTAPVEMSTSGKIYAKLIDDQGNEGKVAEGNIENIDTEGPAVNTQINSIEKTNKQISLSMNITDAESGISKIEWYYKTKNEDNYQSVTEPYKEMNGEEAGEKTAVTKTKAITGLTSGTWYSIYAEVYDVAGNQTRSPKEGEITVRTSFFPPYNEVSKDANGLLTANASYNSDGKTASVPKGFKIIEGIERTKAIADGLVIQDVDENEFVWIPVEVTGSDTETSIASFYRSNWANNARGTSLMNSTTYVEPNPNGYTGEAEEYAEMVKSVYENEGFYIGRYEAGSVTQRTNKANGTTEMVVKKNQYLYNYVGWGTSINDYSSDVSNQGKGAVYLSKKMYEGKNVGVTSTLCYGVQWDAMLDFIKDQKNVTDSSSWGNYTGSIKNTGSNDNYVAKNMYDIAGNAWEWTLETRTTYSNDHVFRGGDCYVGSGSRPAATRLGNWDLDNRTFNEHVGFRVTLTVSI